MTKDQIKQAIELYVASQGNQSGLEGLADILHALNNETESVMLTAVPYITTLTAFMPADLTADQATAAGFTPDVIASLKMTAHPTIRFADMVITFNAYEEISDDLSIWTAIVYDAPNDAVYHVALYLYTDGRIFYNAEMMQH